MATSNAPPPDIAKPAVKPRNPVERLLVRGFILVMLVVVAVEGWSWWSHRNVTEALFKMTGAVDNATDTAAVTETDVSRVLGGKKPSRTENVRGQPGSNGASRLDVYSWFTISPINKRELYVFYGLQGPNDKGPAEVLAVQVSRIVPDEPVKVQDMPASNSEGAPPTMSMPRGGPPGMPGRPGAGALGTTPAGTEDGEKSDTASPDSNDSTEDKATDDKSSDEKPADEKPGAPETEDDSQ